MTSKSSILFRCLSPLAAVISLAFLVGLNPQPAMTQGVDSPSGPFQLDGNTTVDSTICFSPTGGVSGGPILHATPCPSGFTQLTFTGDDWDAIYNKTSTTALAYAFTGPTTCFSSSGKACIKELFNSANDDEFTTGGSKIISPIQSWAWKNGKPQAKDDIEDAGAAAYTLPNGDTGIYFFMDRYDGSGDATAGFWFLQDSSVGQSGGTSCGGSGCPFTGQHVEGDIYAAVDFSTGGPVATIVVYSWDCGLSVGSPCGTAGTLAGPVHVTNFGECNPASPGKVLCGIVDGSTSSTAIASSPAWAFADKSGNSGYLQGEFLEGGIDLQAIFPNAPCITTFMAETVSSTSTSASASDFVAPLSFPLCGISVTKSCPNGSVSSNATSGGRTFTYQANGTVTNTGIGTLYNVSVTDTPEALVNGSLNALNDLENTSGGSLTAPVSVFTLASIPPHTCVRWPSGAPCNSPENPVQYFNFETNTNGPLNSASVSACTQSSASCSTANTLSATSDSDPSTPGNQPASCPTVSIPGSLSVTKGCGTPATCLVASSSGDIVKVNYTGSVCNTSTSSAATFTGVSVSDVNGGSVTGSEKVSFVWPDPTHPGTLAPGACATLSGSYEPTTALDISLGFPDHLTGSATCALCTDGSSKTATSGTADCPVCPLGNCQ